MIKYLGVSLRMTIVSVVVLGLVYPLAMTGAAQVLFPKQANGSMVSVDGKVVGSWIIGQLWTQPKYFQGRPSAAGKGYDPTQTGGTNYGATSAKLMKATRDAIAQLEKDNPDAGGPPPIDLVTSSASGIDPDISPEAAYWEAPRVAKARHLSVDAVRALIAAHVQPRQLGFLGDPHVNVLELNLALDGLKPE
ncbi:MAG TPA: potassium-transporting ATPase subunit KdpC [Candidatus Acidoferrales bacterium]|nr:potassium-transporting ATPase subunit KdpC [Candidatus Acidoferrales bacterium]